MNILYIAHRIPYPPNKGEKIRSFHQIQHLAMHHRVHLACVVDDREDLQYVQALEKYCASVDVVYRNKLWAKVLAVAAIPTPKPLSVVSFYSAELREKIRRRLEADKIDRIFVFSSAMAEYVLDVPTIPKIIDFVDVDSDKWRLYATHHSFPKSWIFGLEARRLGDYERRAAEAFDDVIVVSDNEAALLRQQVKSVPISVVPNGVDLDYFASNDDGPSPPGPPAVVFTGVMDYFPNVDAVRYFCEDVFPLIREELPETRFYIVGRHPVRQVRNLGRRQNVVVTGPVVDVRPFLMRALVAVAPFRIARGIQNKILEAMAMGRPVVGTPQGFQGIEATPDDGIRIESTPEGFARAVLKFLQDAALRNACALRARRYVERHHRWRDCGAQLDTLLRRVS